ncbi:MAG TPA: energy transducer TonB [Pyrinomonadaceae bacterium]
MLALRIAIFLFTLSLGIIASALGRIEVRQEPAVEPTPVDHTCHPTAGEVLSRQCWKHQWDGPGSGSGSSAGSGDSSGFDRSDKRYSNGMPAKVTKPLRITYKQKAQYASEARSNGIEGVVKLRVTFLASGNIGSITTIQGLPYGLTERAIEAARKMRFEPEEVSGVRRTTTRPVVFTFDIY